MKPKFYFISAAVFLSSILFSAILGAPPAGSSVTQDSARTIDFTRDIRPIFSDNCFACHGPDANQRKAHLRLDMAEGVLGVVDPPDSANSTLIKRVSSKDPAKVMPPPASGRSLNAKQIDLLRRWVDEGAEVRPHWSFVPVDTVAVPYVKERSWPRNPIDHFILNRLERESLRHSAQASRESLIRRLSLDLTGLPPAPAEIDAFLGDKSPDAYGTVVDRLLASPHYGERMANDWLDLARYADTYGYQADIDRDMSAWRDWVIRSFNRNLPYDQFIVRQLAGDLLPGATREHELATAFNRLHRQTNEGGSIEEEYRTEYVADRVHTMGTAFLGLTFECSRCHDHKYDPISQRDYYRLFAFFNNIDESGLYSHFTQATPSPTLLVYPEGAEERHKAVVQKIAAAEAELARMRDAARPHFESWVRGGVRDLSLPQPTAVFSFDEVAEKKTPNAVASGHAGELVDNPTLVEGRRGKALALSGDNSVVCKGSGAFKRTDEFTFSLWVRPAEPQARAVVFHRSRAWTDSASRGYELVLENGRPFFGLIHFWPGNAIAVRARDALPLERWSYVAVTYDGSSRAAGVRLYVNGHPVAVEIVRDNLFKDILHRKAWRDTDADKVELTLGARFRDSGFKNGLIDDFQIFDRLLTPLEVQAIAGGVSQVAGTSDELFDYFLRRVDTNYRTAFTALGQLREQESGLIDEVPEIMVMRELPTRRATYVLKRGAYYAPAERVEPGTPASILPLRTDLPRNRLGLASWIVDRRNPLAARVAVNRVWKLHFGRGMVATTENFGSQGQLPSHPELLDWLAGWFMDHGWDRKALHRLIVTSATYRQTSAATPELLERDRDNLLLARGPRHRLEAELIRDSALAASGLLSRRIGGPSVKPYQPAGLWEESGTHKTYVQDKGESLYRRSLYTFWRRTSPPPSMTNFDAPSREVCTARRESTTTPLQALVLLNDPQFVEAARILGEGLVVKLGANVNARIDAATRTLIGRTARSGERAILRRLYVEQLAYFAANPEAAEKLLATGERPRDRALPAAEVAAMAVLASTLMNHDEFVTKP